MKYKIIRTRYVPMDAAQLEAAFNTEGWELVSVVKEDDRMQEMSAPFSMYAHFFKKNVGEVLE